MKIIAVLSTHIVMSQYGGLGIYLGRAPFLSLIK